MPWPGTGWRSRGRLSGPELTVPDGGAYRAGDQVIILAPDHQAALVTSQRGTVEAVDSTNGSLQVGLDDGRKATLAGGQLGSDRLGYGYATTVHRSQGATIDRVTSWLTAAAGSSPTSP